jgi:hypothetical protein
MPLPSHSFPPGLTRPAPGQPGPIGKQPQPSNERPHGVDWRKG